MKTLGVVVTSESENFRMTPAQVTVSGLLTRLDNVVAQVERRTQMNRIIRCAPVDDSPSTTESHITLEPMDD